MPAYISFVEADEALPARGTGTTREYFRPPRPTASLAGACVTLQTPEAYAEMEPHLRKALAGQPVRYQSNPTGPDGESRWFDVQYVPRRGEDGTVVGFASCWSSTSPSASEPRRRCAIARKNSAKAFRNSPDAVILTTLEGKIMEANAGFTRLTGYTFEEFHGPHDDGSALPGRMRQTAGDLLLRTAGSTGG